jgi:tetratricopeptide (TPR) repeat protein
VSLNSLAVVLFPICAWAQGWPSEEGAGRPGDPRGMRDGLERPVDAARPDFSGRFPFDRYDGRSAPSAERDWFPTPLTLEQSEASQARPISGLVSLQQLQHPPSKKAIRAFLEALRYSQAHDIEKAIHKLELAIQISPFFQDAHLNLGVQYARSGRTAEAMRQFQTALDIGPPDAKAYANLGWCYLRLNRFRDAESLARKALALDPANAPAGTLLEVASSR